jgi:hypothetical protein
MPSQFKREKIARPPKGKFFHLAKRKNLHSPNKVLSALMPECKYFLQAKIIPFDVRIDKYIIYCCFLAANPKCISIV